MAFVICPNCEGKGIVNEHWDPISGKFISKPCPRCEGEKYVTLDFFLVDSALLW